MIGSIAVLCTALPESGLAQAASCDATCLAEKTQNPLANVRALMTDNTVVYGTAGGTAYGFQLQPVKSIPTTRGYSVVARAIIPIVGAPPGAGLPRLGGLTPDTPGSGTEWGLSDTMLQIFFAPETSGNFKYGIGPQVSFRTRTSPAVGGAGWGAGVAFVFFGSAGPLSYGAVMNHHWGQGSFSLSFVQPILIYNIESVPGLWLGYTNSITYDWSISDGKRWQVPLGLSVGYTIPFDAGSALDLSVGGYPLVAKPAGGGDWQLKFAVSFFLP